MNSKVGITSELEIRYWSNFKNRPVKRFLSGKAVGMWIRSQEPHEDWKSGFGRIIHNGPDCWFLRGKAVRLCQ